MDGSTQLVISPIARRVGRRKINDEQTPARFAEGTLARIDLALSEKEKRSDFIRSAVERELERRNEKNSDMATPPRIRGKRS